MDPDMVSAAERLARERHACQKYGEKPYTVHLEAVVGVLREFGFEDPALLAAGWLHDTVEDTGLLIDEVRRDFGDEVADLVWAVTGQGSNRRARNEDAYRKIQRHGYAIHLKLADRLANVRSCVDNGNTGLLEMYRREMAGFRFRLGGLGLGSMWGALDALLTATDKG